MRSAGEASPPASPLASPPASPRVSPPACPAVLLLALELLLTSPPSGGGGLPVRARSRRRRQRAVMAAMSERVHAREGCACSGRESELVVGFSSKT